MKDPVIIHTEKPDNITLDGKHNYSVITTMGLAEGGDYYIEIDFKNLTKEDFKIVAELSQRKSSIEYRSELAEKEKYKVSHIVVFKMEANNIGSMKWICESDNPDLYNFEL